MKIAIEGCAHGQLDDIYDTIKILEEEQSIKVDLLLCCGDFQSTRNEQDLRCMAAPPQYANMCTFYKYYSGEKQAPFLTIFIGGNHEASNYLQELPYGGWVAPNIYYLGYAGVVNINGLRIGGLSGIFKKMDYFKGRFEISPYNMQTTRSVYHVRNIDIFRLKQLSGKIDIVMSHDWPANITKHGNQAQLIRFKPFFQSDIESGQLGNPFTEELLFKLKPTYWFSGHLHCKFAALIEHDDEATTKFLALDKCLPKRRFLQIIDIPTPNDDLNEVKFEYDLEWLTILNLTNRLISIKTANCYMPTVHCDTERNNFTPSEQEKMNILSKMLNSMTVPLNFEKTAAAYDPSTKDMSNLKPLAALNPQTLDLCKKLQIDDPVQLILLSRNNLDSSYTDVNLLDNSTLTFAPSELTVSTPVSKRMLDLPNPINDSYNDETTVNDASSTDTSIQRTNSVLELPQPQNCSSNIETTEKNAESDPGEIVDADTLFYTDVTGSLPAKNKKKEFKRRNIDLYKDDD